MLLLRGCEKEEEEATHLAPSMPPPRTRGDGAPAAVLLSLRAAAAAAGHHRVCVGVHEVTSLSERASGHPRPQGNEGGKHK